MLDTFSVKTLPEFTSLSCTFCSECVGFVHLLHSVGQGTLKIILWYLLNEYNCTGADREKKQAAAEKRKVLLGKLAH